VARTKNRALVIGTNALVGDLADKLARSENVGRVATAGRGPTGGAAAALDLDLLGRGAARKLADLLAETSPSVIVDLWRSESAVRPDRAGRYDAAAAEAMAEGLALWKSRGGKSCRLVVWSSTAVYGASEDSPILRIEADQLVALPRHGADAHARWVAELREREAVYADFAAEARWPLLRLRAAALVGGAVRSEISDYVALALPVRIAGYDPPMQVLHQADLLDALERAVTEDASGVLNVVGRGLIPLSRLVALGGRVSVPLPETLARWLAPGSLGTAALKWRCVADGRRAEQVLGFHPRFTAEEALAA
jgi:UDP-glucose 4-epimerase